MGKLVHPRVYHVGYTAIRMPELIRYLQDTEQEEFLTDVREAANQGITEGEILCSLMAKLCYASLVPGKNENIMETRDIKNNLIGCFNQGHGSVFEHASLNFIIHNCSRVFTHELVRHRVGTAFSQTSGRYVRGSTIDIIFDPILDPVRAECMNLQAYLEMWYNQAKEKLGLNASGLSRDAKKKMTSALRRFLPNGQANEIGFSVNLRALRHVIQVRTSRHAEWEIRAIFEQVYTIIKERFPMIFYDSNIEIIDGLMEVSGMKLQPYETSS